MLYKSAALGMAGCCAGRDTQNCGWASSCIDKKYYDAGNCGTNCKLNTFIRKCTDAIAPYCVTWTYPGNGIADYGCESTSSNTVFNVRQTATDSRGDTTSTSLPTVAAAGITFSTSTSNTTTYRTVKKLAIGTIVGIVIAVLALIFFAVVGVCVLLKKRKKAKQLAQNAQIVATAQANRPQSQFNPGAPPPPQQQMQQPPPMPAQSPQPPLNGYFPPPSQQDQKYGHTSVNVNEYAMTPISNPSTPAPAYAQPYVYQNQNAPPMPQQQGQYQPPANGAHEVASPVQQQGGFANANTYPTANRQAHEVDAISVPQGSGNGKPVYEMGGR